MSTMIPQPPPLVSEGLSEDAVTVRQQSILRSLALVQKQQEELSQNVRELERHVVTIPALEGIINKQLMTKQDFEAQRAKDLLEWQPLVKQRVTRKWLITTLSGMGCFLLVGMFFLTLLTAGGVLFLTRLLSL